MPPREGLERCEAEERNISHVVELLMTPDPKARSPVRFVPTDNACRSFETMRMDVVTIMNEWRKIFKNIECRFKVTSVKIEGEDSINAYYDVSSAKHMRVSFVHNFRKTDDAGQTKMERSFQELTVKIPVMYGYHGKVESSDIPDCGNLGGMIPHGQKTRNKLIEKVLIFSVDKGGWFPEYAQKNRVAQLFITSKEHSFKSFYSDKKPQYINIDFAIAKDKQLSDFKFNIKSELAIPETDVIHLIYYYSRWSVDDIKHEISAGFGFKWGTIIRHIIDISFSMLKEEVTYESVKASIKKSIRTYYDKKMASKKGADDDQQKATDDLDFDSYYNQKISEFLVHIPPHDDVMKARFLIQCVRMMFANIFTKNMMINKYMAQSKRCISPGEQFKASIIKSIKTHVENLKKNWKDKGTNDLTVIRGTETAPSIENDLTTMLNRRDKSTMPIIRLGELTNSVKAVMLPNRQNIRCKLKGVVRNMKSRNFDIFSSGFIWKYETTDSAKYVALTDGIAMGVRVVEETLTDQKKIYDKVCAWIDKYVSEIGHGDEMVTIAIMEACVEYKWQIPLAAVDKFVSDFRYAKRRNMFDSLYVTIAVQHGMALDMVRATACADPNSVFMVWVNVSNNRQVQPLLIVKDGELALGDRRFGCLTDMLEGKGSEDYIEFVDALQKGYSKVVQSNRDRLKMDAVTRRTLDFQEIADICASWGSSSVPDIGKQAGVRIHYSAEKVKHHLSENSPNDMNKTDSCTNLLCGHRSLITNSAHIHSEIHSSGGGNMCLSTFMSFGGNIEDGIVVNKRSALNGLLGAISIVVQASENISGNKMAGPNPTNAKHNHTGLNSKGYRDATTVIKHGDALYRSVNTVYSKKTSGLPDNIDSSEGYTASPAGYIGRTLVSGVQMRRVSYNIIVLKLLTEGDKINFPPQKKVIIAVREEHEMPYTKQGVRLDLIFNATCIADRQTFLLLNQMLLTNAASINNIRGDDYIFFDIPTISPHIRPKDYIATARKVIEERLGANVPENYIMSECQVFNPITKRPYHDGTKLFLVGYGYVTRSPQIASDKVSVRNRGHNNRWNEPPAGRGGGSKIGYMELDIIIGSGAARILHDLLHEPPELRRKKMRCTTCGSFARRHVNESMDTWRCDICYQQRLVQTETKYAVTVQVNLERQRGIAEIPVVDQSVHFKRKTLNKHD